MWVRKMSNRTSVTPAHLEMFRVIDEPPKEVTASFLFHQTISILRPAQKELVYNILMNKNSFLLGSRQWGKSTAVAPLAIALAVGYEDDNVSIQPNDVRILSKDLRQAQNMLRAIRKTLEIWRELGVDLFHPRLGSESRIVLKTGRYIEAMPGNSNSIHGFSANIIVDELEASQADSEETFTQANIVASTNPSFRVAIITNSGAKGGFTDLMFHSEDRKWADRRRKFNPISRNVYDVFPDGLPEEIKEIREIMSEAAWDRWYLNMSATGDEQLLTDQEVESCVNKQITVDGGEIIISLDVGMVADPSGLIVAQVGGGQCKVLHAEHLFAWTQEEQIAYVKHLMQEHHASKIIVDQGTVGFGVARTLTAMYPTMTISRSVTNNSRARDAATLQRLFREGNISIPNYDELKKDLISIGLDSKKKVILPRRPTSDKGTGIKHTIHADAADSLMMLLDFVTNTYARGTSSGGPKRSMGVFTPKVSGMW